jgi:tetratricopeptide (TPR) repeat protein
MPLVLRAEALGIDAERVGEAEKIYEDLEARDWGDDALGSGRACLSRAKLVLEHASDAARAAEVTLACAAKHAAHPPLVLGAATLLDRMERGPEGTQLVRAAFEKTPDVLELRAALADRLVAEDQFAEAEQLISSEAEKLNAAGPWAALSHLRRRLRNYDAALETLDKAIAVAPPELSEELHADRADLLLEMGRFADAEAELDEIDSAVFRNVIEGRLLEERGKGAEALGKYSAALEQWPDNWAVRVRAAKLAFDAGDLDRALAELREVTRAAPKETDAALHMSQIYLSRGKLQEAHAFAMRHVNERGATGPEGHLLASRAAAGAKRWEEVSRVLEDLAARHDGKFRAIAFAEHARLNAGEHGAATALDALEAAAAKSKLDLDATEGAPALQQAVALLFETRGADAALARVDAALAKSPGRADLIALRANQLANTGRFDEARIAAEQALAANADEPLAHIALGVAKRGTGDARGAVASFDRAVALDPALSTAGYLAATTLIAAGDTAAGRERLEKIVRAYPDQAAAMNDLAWMLAEEGSDLERAGRLASQATRLDGRAEMLDTVGYVRLKQERFEEAARAFRLSLAKDENYGTARYHLALALERGGDAGAAQQELKLAVTGSAFPELEAAKSALARIERGAAGGAQ